jgi:lipoate---protein ligase
MPQAVITDQLSTQTPCRGNVPEKGMPSKPSLVEPVPGTASRSIGEELACDEILLFEAENHGGTGFLRFWTPSHTGVVAGYTNSLEREIYLAACQIHRIPVYRRITGGGSVVLTPGCLNFTLVLPYATHPDFTTASGTSRLIMDRVQTALQPCLIGQQSTVGGDGDLVLDGRKFLGSAQKRLQRTFLFHASILLEVDPVLIAKLLPPPSRQPAYREQRDHGAFLTNLPLTATIVKERLLGEFGDSTLQYTADEAKIATFAKEKYQPRGG